MEPPRTEWWRPQAAQQDAVPAALAAPGDDPRPGLAFWALLGFTFILLLAPQERFPALAPLRLALVAAAIAIVAHVAASLMGRRPLVRYSPAMGYLAALVAWAFFTLPFSYWPGGSLAFLAIDFMKPLIIFVLLATVIDNMTALKRTVWALALMSLPLAAATLKNFFTGVVTEAGNRVAGYTAGLTGNPNDLALMLNLILPLCVALFLAARSSMPRLLLGSIIGLLVAAVVVTFSRAGFLTLSIIALCYLWRLRRRPGRGWLAVGFLAALLALPFLPSQYFDRLSTIVNIEEDTTNSAQTRLADLKAALRVSVKNPITGVGIGMGAVAMNEERGEMWTEVHNVYLQILVDLGVPGLVLFGLLFAYCYRTTGVVLRERMRQDDGDLLFYIGEGLRISLIAFGVAALFHPVAYHFYFYYFAGLTLAAGVVHARGAGAAGRAPAADREPRHPGWRGGVVAGDGGWTR